MEIISSNPRNNGILAEWNHKSAILTFIHFTKAPGAFLNLNIDLNPDLLSFL
jgi:hypothetical protein